MKKIVIIVAVAAIVLIASIIILPNLKKSATTPTPTPSGPTPTTTNERPVPTTAAVKKCDAIAILSPKDNVKVVSPLAVRVTIDNRGECHWTVFEAQAGTITITDGLGKVVGQGVLKTTQEWTVETPVTYTAVVTLSKPSTSGGTLTITEENPSGKADPQKHSIPVSF